MGTRSRDLTDRCGEMVARPSHPGDLLRCNFVEVRQAILWSGLLLGGQTTDTLTTAIDRARGALEAMPMSARLLELGGIALFWGTKFLLVLAAGTVLFLAARWVRPGHRLSLVTFRVALVAVQAATIGLAYVSLSNTVLLTSLPS